MFIRDDGVVSDSPTDLQEPTSLEPASPAGEQPGVDPELVEDRPARNLKAEYDRKLGEVNRRLDDIAIALARQAAPAPPAVSSPPAITNDDLARLAALGDSDAQSELIRREATKVVDQREAVARAQQGLVGAVQALIARYPMLMSQPDHPFSQAVYRTKAALMNAGAANDLATDREAILQTAALNPELAVDAMTPSGTSVVETPAGSNAWRRPTAVPVTPGVSPRRAPSSASPAAPVLTEAQLALAKRMGVKDPAGAFRRQEERQARGQSKVSHTLVPYLQGVTN